MTGLLVLFVTAFVDMVGLDLMIVPLLPYYATDFGASAGIVGLLVSRLFDRPAPAAPVWGLSLGSGMAGGPRSWSDC